MNEWIDGVLSSSSVSHFFFFQCVSACMFASTNSRCIETHALTHIAEEKYKKERASERETKEQNEEKKTRT